MIGELIERLMCDFEVDLAAVCERHGRPFETLLSALARLRPFFDDGLAALVGDRLRVIGDGALVVRSICASFDPYVQQGGERHARAI